MAQFPDDASPAPDAARWTVSVSRRTDIALRTHLAQRGLKKGDLSKYIEEAVKWRVFRETLAEARQGFTDLSPEEVQALADEAVAAARAGRVPDAG